MSENGTFNGTEIPLENRRVFEVIPSLTQIKLGQGDDLLRQMLGENQLGFTQTSGSKDVELIYKTPLLWQPSQYDVGTDINDSLSKYKQGYVSFKPEYSNVTYTSLRLRYPDYAKTQDPSTIWHNLQLVKEDVALGNVRMNALDLYDRGLIIDDGVSTPNDYALNQQVLEFINILGTTLDATYVGAQAKLTMVNDQGNTIDLTDLFATSITSLIAGASTGLATEVYVDTAINTLTSSKITPLETNKMNRMTNTASGLFTITTSNRSQLTTIPNTDMLYSSGSLYVAVLNSDNITVNTSITIPSLTVNPTIATANPALDIKLIDDTTTEHVYNIKHEGLNSISINSVGGKLLSLSSTNITLPNTLTFKLATLSDLVDVGTRLFYNVTANIRTTLNDVNLLPDAAILTKSEIGLLLQDAEVPFVPATRALNPVDDPDSNPTTITGLLYFDSGVYYETPYINLYPYYTDLSGQISAHSIAINAVGNVTPIGYDMDHFVYDAANMPNRDAIEDLPHGVFLTNYEIQTAITASAANTLSSITSDLITVTDVNKENQVLIVKNGIVDTALEGEFEHRAPVTSIGDPTSDPEMARQSEFFNGVVTVGSNRTITNQVKSTALATQGYLGVDVKTMVEADHAGEIDYLYHSTIWSLLFEPGIREDAGAIPPIAERAGWLFPTYVPNITEIHEYVSQSIALLSDDITVSLSENTVVADTKINYTWTPTTISGPATPVNRSNIVLPNPSDYTSIFISSPVNDPFNPAGNEVRQFSGIQAMVPVSNPIVNEDYEKFFTNTVVGNSITEWYSASTNYSWVHKLNTQVNVLEYVETIDTVTYPNDKETKVALFQPLKYGASEKYYQQFVDTSTPELEAKAYSDIVSFFGAHEFYSDVDLLPKIAIDNLIVAKVSDLLNSTQLELLGYDYLFAQAPITEAMYSATLTAENSNIPTYESPLSYYSIDNLNGLFTFNVELPSTPAEFSSFDFSTVNKLWLTVNNPSGVNLFNSVFNKIRNEAKTVKFRIILDEVAHTYMTFTVTPSLASSIPQAPGYIWMYDSRIADPLSTPLQIPVVPIGITDFSMDTEIIYVNHGPGTDPITDPGWTPYIPYNISALQQLQDLPDVIGSRYIDYFENADLDVNNEINISHGLDDADVLIQVYDGNNNLVLPLETTIVDLNNVRLSFSMDIDSTYKIIVDSQKGGYGSPTDDVADNVFRVVDDSDSTKKLAFECANITTGQTRTIAIPDKSGVMGVMPAGALGTVMVTGADNNLAASNVTITRVGSTDIYSSILASQLKFRATGAITLQVDTDGNNAPTDGFVVESGSDGSTDVLIGIYNSGAADLNYVSTASINLNGPKSILIKEYGDDTYIKKSLTSTTVASDDKVVIFDTDDTDEPKYVTAQSIADLSGFTYSDQTIASATGNVIGDTTHVWVDYTITAPVTVTISTDWITNNYGATLIIKDSGFNASVNSIIVNTEGAETIDGTNSITLNSDGESVSIVNRNGSLLLV